MRRRIEFAPLLLLTYLAAVQCEREAAIDIHTNNDDENEMEDSTGDDDDNGEDDFFDDDDDEEVDTDTATSDLSGCEGVDFLFVIDDSGSMKDEQANLIASFPGFIQAISEIMSLSAVTFTSWWSIPTHVTPMDKAL